MKFESHLSRWVSHMHILSLIWLNNCTVHVVATRNVLKFSEINHIVQDESEVIAFFFPSYDRKAEVVGPV